MLVHCYLRRNVVYVPTVARLKTGAYRDIEPVAVISTTDTDGLRRAIGDAIKRGNEIIPNPPKNNWPAPILPKYAGEKTWSAFASSASLWSVETNNTDSQVTGFRKHSEGYLVEDPQKIYRFPTVGDAIERMIAILQGAARNITA
jgi:hypothetical protein